MEKVVLTLMAAIFCLGVAGATISFYYLILVRPQSILPDPRSISTGKLTWKQIVFYLAVVIGTGACVYQGALLAFAWIPHSWRVFDDEGNARWLGEGLAGLIATFAAIGLPVGALQLGQRTVNAEFKIELLQRELSQR